MNEKIRILIADDHPVVRDGLIAILSTQPDFAVVGEAGDGRAALAQIPTRKPDILLLDLEMPEMDGVETLRQLKTAGMDLPVIVFTAYDTDERIVTAVQAGAKGYLLKGAPRQELFNAIRIVNDGGSLLQPAVATRLMRQMSLEQETSLEPLTPREHEVLEALASGFQNKEIALKLAISERTVKFHVSAILSKLNAGNRTEAVTLAAQHGLIRLDGSGS